MRSELEVPVAAFPLCEAPALGRFCDCVNSTHNISAFRGSGSSEKTHVKGALRPKLGVRAQKTSKPR